MLNLFSGIYASTWSDRPLLSENNSLMFSAHILNYAGRSRRIVIFNLSYLFRSIYSRDFSNHVQHIFFKLFYSFTLCFHVFLFSSLVLLITTSPSVLYLSKTLSVYYLLSSMSSSIFSVIQLLIQLCVSY